MKSIKAGDEQETYRILGTIFEQNLAEGSMTIELARCLCFDILCTAIKIVNDAGINYTFKGNFDPMAYLGKYQTLEQMREAITGIYGELCACMKELSEFRSKNKIIVNIKAYISEHYADSNLSLSSIAEAVSLTPSYISRFFKEQTGQSIVDYINLERIGKANELIEKGNLLISAVGLQVGYSSDIVFIRAFKRYEGITPGKFHE
jgi:YesN/AraC family two-component response regulator